MDKPYAITCSCPGCNKKIKYGKDDTSVPLYCKRHRTESGIRSRIRILKVYIMETGWKPETPVIEKEKMVILLCPSRKCLERTTISHKDWLDGKLVMCPKCGRKMLYHKGVE